MVALEAMACGTPVIASEVGGLGFLVQNGETGYTIPDGDPGVLYDKLSILLDDVNLREAMGKRATKYAQSYTWDKIAAQIVRVYQALLNKNKENGIR
jgi:D-inositol-3-phosphate glycosyltransferase